MRFVPLDWEEEDELVRDTLTCRQRIECTAETVRYIPEEIRDLVYDAWDMAREDIYEQWQQQTEPAEVQPDIPRLFREVGQHLREHWPQSQEYTQEKLEETVASVEAPWGRRYERELREVFEDESLSPVETSRQLVEKVDELGLQPFEAPEPFPPIREQEVKLVCGMAGAPSTEHQNDIP